MEAVRSVKDGRVYQIYHDFIGKIPCAPAQINVPGRLFICFALFSFNIFPTIIHFVNILGTTFSIKPGIFTITRRTKKGRKAHGGIAAF